MIRPPIPGANHRTPRILLAVLLFAGLFLHGQETFACGLMDGKVQSVCCCEAGDMGCAMGGGCGDAMGMAPGDCCEVTVHEAPSLTAAPAGTPVFQALVGDSPPAGAPPPMLLAASPSPAPSGRTSFDPAPASAGTRTYLRTLHLLI